VVQHDSSFVVGVYLKFFRQFRLVSGKEVDNEAVFGMKSIRSGDPGHGRNQLVAGGASVTFATEHTVHTALASEEMISNAPMSVLNVEWTVAGADGKPGQLVGGIGLAAQKTSSLPFSGIKELESGIVGDGGAC
jgi:hypothetical protein